MNLFNNQINQLFPNYSQPQNKSFDPVQFKQAIPNLDKQTLISLVQRARQQGISDADIEQGLNFILNLKK